MAVTTLAQYHGILGKGLKLALANNKEVFKAIAPLLLTYAQQGADERDSVRALLKWYWVTVLGNTFDGHKIKHYLTDNAVDGTGLSDIPEVNEPIA